MKYACNISYELMEILKQNPDFCDYIKIGAFGETEALMTEAYALKPLMIHGFGWHERGGIPSTKAIDYDKINKYVKSYNTPFIGIHALCFNDDLEAIGQGDKRSSKVLEHMIRRFKEFSKKINVKLLIENMDYSPHYAYETTIVETVRPEFIKMLIKKTGLELLLDTSHAKVSAYQLGMDIYTYLENLPLEAIREIHFSGTAYEEGLGYKDIHGVMDRQDYDIAQYLRERLLNIPNQSLEMITLEYGTVVGQSTEREAIIEQMDQLKTIFK